MGANTQAAFRGGSKKVFTAKIEIVTEEADENLYWLELLTESDTILKDKCVAALMKETEEIIAIFVSIKDHY